ncbi:CHAT domain-containing protein [Streptantibioticus rubrisoli]|uniref:CHAT domain-containing protein n=1 Tax=Streptantibioticus rubrisoli TaxID=1387313 RepID=A0ABT1P7T7_9ACTN|nr:CHAT domain-containing protein [Streptantibioticus rubrisoli]MCQ4041440.1 CHAT domain-containing protein [Streptantibioticus rubrisoli]
MNAQRARAAEEWLGWPPIPRPPLRFHARLAAVGRALADYVDGDASARRRIAATLDKVLADPHFGACAPEFRLAVVTRAGVAHNWCGVAETNQAELHRARELLTDGLRIASAHSPDAARLHYTLASTVHVLYQFTSDPNLLTEALSHARRGVACAGDDPRLAAQCRAGLASVLQTSFRVCGSATVLAEAVEHAQWSVEVGGRTTLGHRFRYVLADVLTHRYDAYGSLDDLNRAIALLRKAAESRDYVMAPTTGNAFHGALGGLLRRLYLRIRDRAVLDEAVELAADAVGDDDSRADPVALTNLGNVLLARYHDYRDPDDLLRAVDLQLKTINARQAGDWQLASGHNNAGNALTEAWRVSGDDRLADLAVTHYRTALELTADNAPELASRAYNLGTVLQARSAGVDRELLVEAAAAYGDAVRHGLDTSLEWALAAAVRWGDSAVGRGSWEEACEAYTGGLKATERLFRIQLLREDKETWLADSQGLPTEAAYALFRAGRREDAVLALETGRSLLLSEALEEERADLGRLDTGHADLVDAYRRAVTALDQAMHGGTEPSGLRRCREAVDEAITNIRAVTGYERFLARPDIAEVHKAVPPGAVVVYIAAAGPAGVALAVDGGGQISAAELPAATSSAVRRRADALLDARRSLHTGSGTWKGVLDAVTRWAWSAVVAPVLPIIGDAEEVIIVPSGTLAMLPLHAAWRPGRDGSGTRHYLLDERTVRYVPNARALEVTRRLAARTADDRLVVVADPQPTSWQPIGYARAEAAWAQRWFAASQLLHGTDADREAVVSALSGAQVHHFICHGRAQTDQPLNSALILADDQELTLREILTLRPSHPGTGARARLTVLSACDTDRPGTSLPDEVISLPSGLIQAGVAGVVASQWAVRSEAVSLLMARFYQLWRSTDTEPAAALRAAQRWLRDTTNREKVQDLAPALDPPTEDGSLEGLVRGLQLRDPDARPYLHPSDWAALSYHGS